MQFTPNQDFHDDDLRSDYCVGYSYTVRPGNDVLAAKVEGWLAAGMVREGGPDTPKPAEASVKGAGKVK